MTGKLYFKKDNGDFFIELFLKLPYTHSLFENNFSSTDKLYLDLKWCKREFGEIDKFLDNWGNPSLCKSSLFLTGKIKSTHKRITIKKIIKKANYCRVEFNKKPTHAWKQPPSTIEINLSYKNIKNILSNMNITKLHGGSVVSYSSLYFLKKNKIII